MQKFSVIDNETHEIINEVQVENEDELMELEEMSEALGFYIEEVE
jgi:hypothetical protein